MRFFIKFLFMGKKIKFHAGENEVSCKWNFIFICGSNVKIFSECKRNPIRIADKADSLLTLCVIILEIC